MELGCQAMPALTRQDIVPSSALIMHKWVDLMESAIRIVLYIMQDLDTKMVLGVYVAMKHQVRDIKKNWVRIIVQNICPSQR